MGCGISNSKNLNQIEPEKKQKNIQKSSEALKKKEEKLHFEEYELINLQKLYEKEDSSVIVNLVAYIGDQSIPFFVQKYMENKKEYDKEKLVYDGLVNTFGEGIQKNAIMMESYNDQKQEIYFRFGKCTLKNLAQQFKKAGKLVPNELIALTFKIVSKMMLTFYEKGYFYTDNKPENLVLEFNEGLTQKNQKQIFNLKFIDFGEFSNKIEINSGYTPHYYTSELYFQRKQEKLIKYQNKEERLQNEFYTLARTIIRMLIEEEEDQKTKFESEIDTIKKVKENNEFFLNTILQKYKEQIEKDSNYGQIVQKIFDIINRLVSSNVNFQQLLVDIKKLIEEIKIDYFVDDNNYIQKIASDKIDHKQGEINPLEMLLSLNCNIELHGSRYANQPSDKKLEDMIFEYLNNENQRIYLLLGKSGSGKSLFVRKFFSKLCQISAENQNQQIKNNKESRINYQFLCKYIKLNGFGNEDGKYLFSQEVKKYIDELKQDGQQLVLLLDGFDEFGEGKDQILDLIGIINKENNKIEEEIMKKLKIIVSCRSTAITDNEIDTIFKIQGKEQQTEVQYICAVQKEQMHEYIKRFVEIVNQYKDSKLFGKFNAFKTYEEYKQMLEGSQSLQDMATEPFTIRLLVGIMPDIRDKFGGKGQGIKITIFEILQIYVEKWIENEISRLNSDEQYILADEILDIDLNDLGKSLPEGVKKIGEQSLKLIEYLWINNLISNNNFSNEDLEKISEQFDVNEQNLKIIVKCLPIVATTKNDKISYSFFHKSILDYFLARYWLQDFTNEENKDRIVELKNLNISKKFICKEEYSSLYMLADYVIETSNRFEDKKDSMALYRQCVNVCIQAVNLSKQEGFKELEGPSNAMTLLNAIRYTFSGLDLSNIKIQNANLDSGVFDGTTFKNSQISNTDFKRSNLSDSNFEKSQLKNIEIGIPKPDLLGHEAGVNSVALSKDGKYVVSGDQNGSIKAWNYETGGEVKTFEGDCCTKNSVTFSKNGKFIVVGCDNGKIKVMSTETKRYVKTLVGHSSGVISVTISSDSKYIVSGSEDYTIKIWNLESGQEIKTLNGHSSSVNSLVISSDSKYIVSGSWDTTIKIWNLESGQEIKTLNGNSSVNSVAISSDSKYIVSGSADNSIKIWNFESGQEIKTLKGHKDRVTSVAISSDSKYIVSGSWDKTIKIWDLESGQEIKTLNGHSSNVKSVAISSDSKYIVSGSNDKTIKIWNLESGQEIKTLTGHNDAVNSVAISSDSKYIVSGSCDNSIKIWNFESGQEIKTLAGHSKSVDSVAISSDSKYIVSGSDDKTIKIWNLENGQEIKTLQGHSWSVKSVSISSDSKYIVSGSEDYTIKIWNLESGQQIKTLTGHSKSVLSVAISSDNKYIVSGSEDKTIKIWNLESGQKIKTLTGHSESVLSVAISSDSKYIVSGGDDKTIKIWNLESGQEIKTLTGHSHWVKSVSISSDSKYIVSGSYDYTIKIWNFESGQEIKTLSGHSHWVKSVSISSDNKYIVSGSEDKTIKIWNFESGQEIKTLNGHSKSVLSVAISSDSKYIVSGSYDNFIKIWNFESGQEIKTLNGHSKSIRSVAISSNSKYIISGSEDETIKIWNLESGQVIKTLAGHSRSVDSVAISSDNKYIVSGSEDKTIKIWNFESGQEIKTLTGHSYTVYSVAISSDSKYIVSGSDDKTIKIWNFETGQEIKKLAGHSESVLSVAISSDNKYIVSGSEDKTIKIWNLETGQEIKTLNGHSSSVLSVAISLDNKYIVSGSEDKTIKIWNLESGQEIKTLNGHSYQVNSIAISSDDKYIVSGSCDNSIKIWSLESGQEIKSEIQSNGSIIIKQEQGEQILKYKINLSQGNYIGIEKIESNEQNSLNNKKKLTYKQDDNKPSKKADNWIFVASSDNLKQMTIKKDKKYEYITIQEKYPAFTCLGIQIKGAIGLTKNQLRILAQRSKQDLKEMIDKAEK